MIKSRVLLLILILAMIFSSAVYSADDSGVWWDGMPMTAFRYTGLRNVKEITIDRLLQPYLGEPYSDAEFSEMMSVLYAQDWLSYASAEALRDGETGNLIIRFDIQENPMISSVTVEGENRIGERPLVRAQGFAVHDFFTPGSLNANRSLVLDYYLSRGYRDATVDVSYTENEEDNTVQILFTVSEGKQYKVRDILYEGINGLSAKEINSVLTQKKKSFFSSGNLVMSNLDTDRDAIVMLYGTEGYPDAAVVNIEVVPTEEEDENVTYVNIIYTIEEGDRWLIGDISFSGNEVFSDESIQSLISIEPGDPYDATEILMQQAEITPEYRQVVGPCLERAKKEGSAAMAIELPDGTIITGGTSKLLGASAAGLLNALKELAGIEHKTHVIAPAAIEPIQKLKINYLGAQNPALHTDETLIALSMSAATDRNAAMAMEQLPKLRGCQVHTSCILADVDERMFKTLGIEVTSEPVVEKKKKRG